MSEPHELGAEAKAMAELAASPARRPAALSSFARRHWGKALLALLLLGAVAIALQAARGPQVPARLVKRLALEQRVVATGRSIVSSRATLGVLVPGRVVEVLVEEGARVEEGQLLLRLQDDEARAQVALAEAGVAEATARLSQLEEVSGRVASEELSQTETTAAQAELQFERQRALHGAGASTEQELEDARKNLELARSRRDSAAIRAQAQRRGGADQRLSQAAQASARAQAALAKARLANLQVRAPAAGTVLVRAVEPGDVVQPGAALLVFGKTGKTSLLVEPDERSLALLAVGQKATAAADAFPGQLFEARIERISPSVDPTRGTIEVRLAVDEPPAFLRPELTVGVEVAIERKEGVLVLPTEAIRELSSLRPWVWTARDGLAGKRDVGLGIRGDGSVEVVSGLAEGEVVLVPGALALTVGRRVRPVVEDPGSGR